MTREPVNDNRHFEGKLERFENGRLVLDLTEARRKMRPKDGTQSVEIELGNVEKANLVPEI
jgi:ribosome maturation factor RimP